MRPDEIGDLRLMLPRTASGHANLRIALVAADGTIIANAATQLNVAADHKVALIARPDESGRIADLIAHGQKMIEVGYLPGARVISSERRKPEAPTRRTLSERPTIPVSG